MYKITQNLGMVCCYLQDNATAVMLRMTANTVYLRQSDDVSVWVLRMRFRGTNKC